MTDEAKIYVGDSKTVLTVDAQRSGAAAIDLTGMTLSLEVWKPGAIAPVSWPGTMVGTTYIRYTTVPGDWSLAGEYRIQAKMMDGLEPIHGASYRFDVHALGT